MDRESWYIPDNRFNRANYPDLIGRHFRIAPSYANVWPSKLPSVELLCTELTMITTVGISKLNEVISGIKMVYPHCEGCGKETEWPTKECVNCV